MIFIRRFARCALIFSLLTASAHAQICREPGNNGRAPNGKTYIDCDHTYREIVVDCLPSTQKGGPGTRPSCPTKPMPMLRTPLKAPVSDYTPWVYNELRDPGENGYPYNGLYTVGTPSGPDRVYKMTGTPVKNVKRVGSCNIQLRMGTPNYGTTDEAKQARLQQDACTNEYVLNWAIYPYQKERTRLINDPTVSGAPVSLATECQPLRTFPETENEYSASEYLRVAWIKTLQDPSYRKPKRDFAGLPSFLKIAASAFLNGGSITGALMHVDPEPRLPNGIGIANPVAPPDPFPDVRLSSIAALSYEEINDPTHPYSPRWDFTYTDRDYSMLVKAAGYMTNDASKDSVYCAGVRKSNQSDAQKKADEEVRVDVLSFREPPFSAGIVNRIAYNTVCRADKNGTSSESFPFATTIATSYCWHITPESMALYAASCWVPFVGCQQKLLRAKKDACWKCFGHGSNQDKVDDDSEHPPCATHYGGKDYGIQLFRCGLSVCVPGALNALAFKATCNVVPPFIRKSEQDIDNLCKNVRKPYTSLNKLKMRYYNPGDKENISLTDGVPEGYRFKEYFGNHMPYPRLWDTGNSLQTAPVNDRNYQAPNDTTGQYTTIVGIGREGATPQAGSAAQKDHKDERCMLGGWGGINIAGQSVDALMKDYGVNSDGTVPTPAFRATHPDISFTGVRNSGTYFGIPLPDPLTSWTELKLYQARVQRYANISCLGRYEKVFKYGGSENVALSAQGGEWSNLLLQKCPKDKNAADRACTFITLSQLSDAKDDSRYYVIPQTKLEGWPLGWRGYMATGTGGLQYEAASAMPGGSARNIAMSVAAGVTQFPQFGGAANAGVTLYTGLNNAQPGDIVMLPRGGAEDGLGSKPGLAKVAYVAEANVKNCATDKKDCYVVIYEADNGQNPDVCGTTDAWNELRSRKIYPVTGLPTYAREEYDRVKSNGSCENPKITPCQLPTFYTSPVYRPAHDLNVRAGCGKDNTKDCV